MLSIPRGPKSNRGCFDIESPKNLTGETSLVSCLLFLWDWLAFSDTQTIGWTIPDFEIWLHRTPKRFKIWNPQRNTKAPALGKRRRSRLMEHYVRYLSCRRSQVPSTRRWRSSRIQCMSHLDENQWNVDPLFFHFNIFQFWSFEDLGDFVVLLCLMILSMASLGQWLLVETFQLDSLPYHSFMKWLEVVTGKSRDVFQICQALCFGFGTLQGLVRQPVSMSVFQDVSPKRACLVWISWIEICISLSQRVDGATCLKLERTLKSLCKAENRRKINRIRQNHGFWDHWSFQDFFSSRSKRAPIWPVSPTSLPFHERSPRDSKKLLNIRRFLRKIWLFNETSWRAMQKVWNSKERTWKSSQTQFWKDTKYCFCDRWRLLTTLLKRLPQQRTRRSSGWIDLHISWNSGNISSLFGFLSTPSVTSGWKISEERVRLGSGAHPASLGQDVVFIDNHQRLRQNSSKMEVYL